MRLLGIIPEQAFMRSLPLRAGLGTYCWALGVRSVRRLLLYFRISGLASIWQSSEQGSESLATSVDAQVRVDDVAIHRVVEVSSAWHSSDRVGRWPSRLVATATEEIPDLPAQFATVIC